VVFYAGVEMQMQDFYDVIKGKGMYFAIGSFIVTYLMGFLVGLYFLDNYTSAMFLALCIAVTALPVSVKILSDLGRLHTRTGSAIIGTAIVHDVIALSMLGLLIGLNVTAGSADPWNLMLTMLKIALFLLMIFTVERSFHLKNGWLAKKFSGFVSRLKTKEAQFSVALIVSLYFAVVAEFLGLSYIIGAFFGGLIISKKILGTNNYMSLRSGVSSISIGFFAPIFIAYLGLLFDLKELESVAIVVMFITILIFTMGSKFVSGFLGARMAGYSNREAKIIGTGINARGMMDMVVALTAFKYGFIEKNIFTILVAMTLITTLIIPSLLKRLYKKLPEEEDLSDSTQSPVVECNVPG